jgi:hypothetical protein
MPLAAVSRIAAGRRSLLFSAIAQRVVSHFEIQGISWAA